MSKVKKLRIESRGKERPVGKKINPSKSNVVVLHYLNEKGADLLNGREYNYILPSDNLEHVPLLLFFLNPHEEHFVERLELTLATLLKDVLAQITDMIDKALDCELLGEDVGADGLYADLSEWYPQALIIPEIDDPLYEAICERLATQMSKYRIIRCDDPNQFDRKVNEVLQVVYSILDTEQLDTPITLN